MPEVIKGIKFIRVLDSHCGNPALHIHDWRKYNRNFTNNRYIFKISDFANNANFKDYKLGKIIQEAAKLGAKRNTAEGYRDYLVIIALNLWVFMEKLLENLNNKWQPVLA